MVLGCETQLSLPGARGGDCKVGGHVDGGESGPRVEPVVGRDLPKVGQEAFLVGRVGFPGVSSLVFNSLISALRVSIASRMSLSDGRL